MTDEVGVLTGDLTVHTTWIHGEAQITVQSTGAEEWHTLHGSPVAALDEATGRAVHQAAVETVKVGGGQGLSLP